VDRSLDVELLRDLDAPSRACNGIGTGVRRSARAGRSAAERGKPSEELSRARRTTLLQFALREGQIPFRSSAIVWHVASHAFSHKRSP
jgi:hypothetical protein